MAPPPEVVDPLWLLKAFAAMVLLALVCGYLTLCLLFYRGQWQLVLHPSRTSAAPSSLDGNPVEVVSFGAGASPLPQLTGWWIAAPPGSAFAHLTVLYLPGEDGSLATDQALLRDIHAAGISLFAIDYRGYGKSAEQHPSERSMTGDAATAWEYLTTSRGLRSDRIIPYGKGVGASLALALAAQHTSVPALILDGPEFHIEEHAASDPRSRLLPVRLLFRNRFALRPQIDTLPVPKLILSRSAIEDPLVLSAADPKTTVALPLPAGAPGVNPFGPALKRFLDQYAPPTEPPPLVSEPAPQPRK